jgi:hypothetical protein
VTGFKSRVPGFRLNKHGRLVRDERRLDVSARLRQRASKRVKVVSSAQTSLPLWRR